MIKNRHIPPVEKLFENPHVRSVEEWMRLVFMSRSNLSRHIHLHYNGRYTPKDFLYENRLRVLKNILKNDPEITCENLAIKANFSSRRYLMHFLSYHFGVTFAEFRRNPDRFVVLENKGL